MWQGERIGMRSVSNVGGSYVVGVPIFGQTATVLRCLRSIDRYTPPQVELLLLDDGSKAQDLDDALVAFITNSNRVIHWAAHMENEGFPAAANSLFAMAGRSDVILTNSDVVVGARWAEALHGIVGANGSVATVTAATNVGTLASLADFRYVCDQDGPDSVIGGLEVDEEAVAILPTAIGHCVYFTRNALDLVGTFDSAFGRGYGEEVDFSQRAVALGFIHLLAPSVLVFHEGSVSFASVADAHHLQERNEERVWSRHPSYPSAIAEAGRQHLGTGFESRRVASLRLALVARRGLHLGLDCRMVGDTNTGTGRLVRELGGALASDPRVRILTLYVNRTALMAWFEWLAETGASNVDVQVADSDFVAPHHQCDVLFRPTQFSQFSEMGLALTAAPRWHLNVLDGIAYEQPNYFPCPEAWVEYRHLQEYSMALADGLSAISATVVNWIRASGLDRSISVLPLGTEHIGRDGPAVAPASPQPMGVVRLLQYGAAFTHKNRQFSIRIAEEVSRSGIDVELTLIGPTPTWGSSRDGDSALAERLLAAAARERRVGTMRVVDRGFVSDSELFAAVRGADVVLYPSVVEGFGFVPFESALLGTPCLSSSGGSLSELLPSECVVEGFDTSQWAMRVLDVWRSGADANLMALVEGAAGHRWADASDHAIELSFGLLRSTRASYTRRDVTIQGIEAQTEYPQQAELELVKAELSEAYSQLEGLAAQTAGAAGRALAQQEEIGNLESELMRIYQSKRWKRMNDVLKFLGK